MTQQIENNNMTRDINFMLEVARYEEHFGFQQMLEHLEETKATLEKAMRDIDRGMERVKSAREEEEGRTVPEEVFSWVVNDLQNMTRNLRFDRAVSVSSRYAMARVKLEALR
ncbi:MAG: hypothetical protein HGA97_00890 [Chlorobiaceae bacterium]|nr:hypothetical protein [Chlorobiaceae bacterium]